MDHGDDETVPTLEKVDLPAELMPKGYRKVEIEMDADEADEDPFGGDDDDKEIELDDLPDLEQPVVSFNVCSKFLTLFPLNGVKFIV